MRSWRELPMPAAQPGSGHLLRWSTAPVALLEEGARLGPVFRLRFGVPTVVGSCFTWNKRLLTDLESFGSSGSFSQVVPYLAGGIILTDAPAHKARRAELNPTFGPQAMTALQHRVRAALHATTPTGTFDALAWADRVTLRMLNAAYFSGDFDPALLHAFLAPLRRPFPTPALPRPHLFARVTRELRRLAEQRLAHGGDDLLAHLARLPGGLTEARISLAAGHDTTTHTLAWTVWHLAQHPEWFRPEGLRPAVRETLRLYPTGWMGSRRLKRDVAFDGTVLPRGTLALYSPYLSGRDPNVWTEPTQFRPERFERPPPPWAYLPFGGGERVCLGMHLAHLLLHEALHTLLGQPLIALRGDPTPRPGVTLGPSGPLVVRRA